MEALWSDFELGIKPDIQKCGLGLIYAGSKKKLSVDIFNTILDDCGFNKPFVYDVFGGGGALSFQAAYSGMDVLYNDLDSSLYRFFRDLHNFKNSNFADYFYNNFVNHSDFMALRDSKEHTAAITALLNIYSYGGLMSYYGYKKDDITIKKNAHYLITQNNYHNAEVLSSYCKGKIGHKNKIHNLFFDLHEYFKDIGIEDRHTLYQQFTKKIETIYILEAYDFVKKWDIKKFVETEISVFTKEYSKRLGKNIRALTDIKGIDVAYVLKHFNLFDSIMRMANASYLNKIQTSNVDFKELEIKHNPNECIILCDIPYKAIGWRLYKQNINMNYTFDFDYFYEWVRKLAEKGYKVYICEYEMPDDFKVIMEKDYVSTFSCEIVGGKKVKERLYTYDI